MFSKMDKYGFSRKVVRYLIPIITSPQLASIRSFACTVNSEIFASFIFEKLGISEVS